MSLKCLEMKTALGILASIGYKNNSNERIFLPSFNLL